MLDGTQSGCINHPGVESSVRCKQCGKPVCNACVVVGPRGRFCSIPCQQRFEAFAQQAQASETKARGSFFVKLRNTVGALVIIVVALAVVGVVSILFEVPVLSGIAWKVRGLLGI